MLHEGVLDEYILTLEELKEIYDFIGEHIAKHSPPEIPTKVKVCDITEEELEESIKTRYGAKLYKAYLAKDEAGQRLMRLQEAEILRLTAEIKANMAEKLEPISRRIEEFKLT